MHLPLLRVYDEAATGAPCPAAACHLYWLQANIHVANKAISAMDEALHGGQQALTFAPKWYGITGVLDQQFRQSRGRCRCAWRRPARAALISNFVLGVAVLAPVPAAVGLENDPEILIGIGAESPPADHVEITGAPIRTWLVDLVVYRASSTTSIATLIPASATFAWRIWTSLLDRVRVA